MKSPKGVLMAFPHSTFAVKLDSSMGTPYFTPEMVPPFLLSTVNMKLAGMVYSVMKLTVKGRLS